MTDKKEPARSEDQKPIINIVGEKVAWDRIGVI